VWHIEAKKLMNGQWSFLHFQRKIIGSPPPEAYPGIKWTWTAKVWDPQCSAQNIQASFSSPDLPPWLSWRGNLLAGVPTPDLIGRSYKIVVLAATHLNSKSLCLDFAFDLSVKPVDEMGEIILMVLLSLPSLSSLVLIPDVVTPKLQSAKIVHHPQTRKCQPRNQTRPPFRPIPLNKSRWTPRPLILLLTCPI
jgi:hypothetical protein